MDKAHRTCCVNLIGVFDRANFMLESNERHNEPATENNINRAIYMNRQISSAIKDKQELNNGCALQQQAYQVCW